MRNLFIKRSLAYLIDLIFFYFVLFQLFNIIFYPMVGLSFSDVNAFTSYVMSNNMAMAKFAAGITTALFVLLAYFMLFEVELDTTLGKYIMHLKLNKEITYWQAFLRNLTKSVLFFLLPIDAIGFLLFGKRFTELLAGNASVVEFGKHININGN
jgi:uncharacterized RDD family membrane protein YckC